jgi:glycosyltransferase involved in cell wall biosynthesis
MTNPPPQTFSLSIILPAKNEERGLAEILPRLRQLYPQAELLVVDDGSIDQTAEIARAADARVLSHPFSMGNGAAVKTGARHATGDTLVFLDADAQHSPDDVGSLLGKLQQGYDMAVGARTGTSQASLGRWYANSFYNRLASWMVGHRIEDLTSGLRAVNAKRFREFLYLLPNGFSYPTTITMCFFRAGYPVGYLPIRTYPRRGKSHIRLLKDGVRFLIIIFRIGTLYSPLKLFIPISLIFFSMGLGYYAYTFAISGRFTNMSGLLFTTSVLIFLIGLVSEQITNLLFSRSDRN